MSKATAVRHGKKVRITLDIAESLVKDIDDIRKQIGVDRSALIKVWLHEKVKQGKGIDTTKSKIPSGKPPSNTPYSISSGQVSTAALRTYFLQY